MLKNTYLQDKNIYLQDKDIYLQVKFKKGLIFIVFNRLVPYLNMHTRFQFPCPNPLQIGRFFCVLL